MASATESLTKCCSPIRTTVTTCILKADLKNSHFRFLDLPPEVRILTYEFALDFKSIDRYLKRYFEIKRLEQSGQNHNQNQNQTQNQTQNQNQNQIQRDRAAEAPPEVNMACPSILLVNREISHEALAILHSTPLNISYGVLGQHLNNLISPHLVRKLRRITVSDMGCRDVDTPHNSTFTGYCYAVVQLASIFRHGHSLKSITIAFTSSYVTKHLEHCLLNKDKKCGIKTWAANLRRFLKEIRGVEKVQIDVELPKDWKKDIVETMTTPAGNLLALPYHIRKQIYAYAADYNDGIKAMRNATKDLAFSIDPPRPVKSTPTIFLLNKQILNEAQQVLLRRPLVISDLAPVVHNAEVSISKYMSLGGVNRLRYLSITITDYRHLQILDDMADNFMVWEHKLEQLHIDFSEPRLRRIILESGHYYPDKAVAEGLVALKYLRGLKHVSIMGTLPKCFVEPLIYNMTQVPRQDGRMMVLMAENAQGEQIDIEQLTWATYMYRPGLIGRRLFL